MTLREAVVFAKISRHVEPADARSMADSALIALLDFAERAVLDIQCATGLKKDREFNLDRTLFEAEVAGLIGEP